jgi:transcription antitermination protein NusB
MKARRAARERLLWALYQYQITGQWPVTEELRRHFDGTEPIIATPVDEAYVDTIEATLKSSLGEIDALLARASRNWRIERMAAVDLGLLRLATAELLVAVAPPRVVVNEAVELAKRYGTETSFTFVNGVLDGVIRALQQQPGLDPYRYDH